MHEQIMSRKSAARMRWRVIKRYRYEYLIFLPVLAFFLLFKYIPMYGVTLAFKDFRVADGILGSPWLEPWYKMFARAFSSDLFLRALKNTLIISLLKLVVAFPFPVLFSLLLDELPGRKLGKLTQTVSYLPYFISWVVLGGILRSLLSPSYGPINYLLQLLTGNTVYFLGEDSLFRGIVFFSYLWKTMGYNAVIYLAAIAGINQEQYEAARIDGASRWKLVRYITIPSIAPVIVTMLILNMGTVLNAGFDQIFNLYSPVTYASGDVINTYVYRVGIEDLQYSYATAVGLFQNAVGLVLVLLTNRVAKRIDPDNGLF